MFFDDLQLLAFLEPVNHDGNRGLAYDVWFRKYGQVWRTAQIHSTEVWSQPNTTARLTRNEIIVISIGW